MFCRFLSTWRRFGTYSSELTYCFLWGLWSLWIFVHFWCSMTVSFKRWTLAGLMEFYQLISADSIYFRVSHFFLWFVMLKLLEQLFFRILLSLVMQIWYWCMLNFSDTRLCSFWKTFPLLEILCAFQRSIRAHLLPHCWRIIIRIRLNVRGCPLIFCNSYIWRRILLLRMFRHIRVETDAVEYGCIFPRILTLFKSCLIFCLCLCITIATFIFSAEHFITLIVSDQTKSMGFITIESTWIRPIRYALLQRHDVARGLLNRHKRGQTILLNSFILMSYLLFITWLLPQ